MSSQYRLFVRFPLLLSIALICLMGTFSKRGLLDWRRMVDQNNKLEHKVATIRDQKIDLERQIEQFQKNPEEQERVVRQVLGYIKANETVIEFP
ncbi:MAG: septum formation initiator family protein [Proteobacteria bacterium]|nr:septum formation initiator family protein [Pseudomonadota bacterium]NQW45102.1 septum formation initiator family protein [Deltaproteobacteria bacterium]